VARRRMRYTKVMQKTSRQKSKKQPKKVDYEPNKMGLAVAALAAVSLVLFALLTFA
jgi:hypothetical protein